MLYGGGQGYFPVTGLAISYLPGLRTEDFYFPNSRTDNFIWSPDSTFLISRAYELKPPYLPDSGPLYRKNRANENIFHWFITICQAQNICCDMAGHGSAGFFFSHCEEACIYSMSWMRCTVGHSAYCQKSIHGEWSSIWIHFGLDSKDLPIWIGWDTLPISWNTSKQLERVKCSNLTWYR